jgi:hypothetical protein
MRSRRASMNQLTVRLLFRIVFISIHKLIDDEGNDALPLDCPPLVHQPGVARDRSIREPRGGHHPQQPPAP